MAPTERTPLIQVIPIAPPHERYPHHTLRRVCTVVLTAIPIFVIAILLYTLFLPTSIHGSDGIPVLAYLPWSPSHSISSAWPNSDGVSFEQLSAILLETPKEEKAREWSRYYTSGPHLAGKNLSQAEWTRDLWKSFGVKSEIVAYDIYVNYPKDHRLALLEEVGGEAQEGVDGEDKKEREWKIKFEAGLEEDVLDEDSTSGLEDRIPTFHGYSASGNVTAQYVYVNYGSYQDFEDLQKANVDLEGKIALIKYGGIFRGLKVKRAQELGMVGAIIYSDPGDDGQITEHHGNKTYPEGPAREPSSVQRGSTQFLSFAPGDPTTPGYPSKPGVPRQPVDAAIPSIPSIPISYMDALPLLKALNGHGPNVSSFNKYWQGGGLGHKGVHYNIGPSPPSLTLNLMNEQEYVTTPMWNVIGIINGSIPDEVVVLGNHRDAWIAGGAGDPNSGSAALNEVVRSFSAALAAGWKPLRTIVLASWDGEEYGLLGSTEWVEEYLPWLQKATIAYLNVDVGTTGPHFKASGAPLLNKVLYEAASLVQSPNQTIANQTIRDTWSGHISTMGSGSDFTAFQDFAGIPCVDMGFSAGPDTAVYHYHSNYDSFDWMERFGDPGWHYHIAITKVWALLAAKLIESPIVPLNATDYAVGLKRYLDAAKEKARAKIAASSSDQRDLLETAVSTNGLFDNLDAAIARLHNVSVAFDRAAASLADEIEHNPIPWWKWWEKVKLYYRVRAVNDKYKYLERQFLYAPGLDGRSWFKHVVFAPGKWTGYAGATFPGLVEAIGDGEWGQARKWAGIVTGVVHRAAASLEK